MLRIFFSLLYYITVILPKMYILNFEHQHEIPNISKVRIDTKKSGDSLKADNMDNSFSDFVPGCIEEDC